MEATQMHLSHSPFRPGYILSTNAGIYNGTIKHNLLKSLSPAFKCSAVSFVDMFFLKKTLSQFSEQTLKPPLDYFNLIKPSEIDSDHSNQTPITILTPFSGCTNMGRNAALQGFQKTHSEYLVNNKTKISISENYLPLVNFLKPTFAVSPIEQLETNGSTGKKKMVRAAKNSQLAFLDCLADKKTKWLFPIVLESLQTSTSLAQFLDLSAGVVVYGGHQMNLAAKFDALRSFFAIVPENKLKVIANKASIIDVLIGIMAGADLFETDYPLALAQQGLTLLISAKGYNADSDWISILKSKYKTADTGEDKLLMLSIVAEQLNDRQLCVDLKLFQRGFRWEENPLVEGCTCYTCINYSRSYIYHLYEVKEMNATILTALHNMKAYDDMFNFFGTKLDLPNRVAWFILQNFKSE